MRRGLMAWVVVLAGCGLVPNDPAPADGPQSMTECSVPLAFEGETSIAALDLVEAIPGIPEHDASRRGMIQITRDAVKWEDFAPPNVPPAVDAGQLLCVTWDDGSGMATLLRRPFAAEVGDPSEGTEASVISATPVFIALAVLVIAAASWLAFRREVRTSDD